MEHSTLLVTTLALVITRVALWRVEPTAAAPLHDVLHAGLPNLRSYEAAIDLVPLLLVFVVAYLYLLDGLDASLLNGLVWSYAVLMILRALTFSVTILPSPVCSRRTKNLSIGGCHDLVFSGHVTATLLLAHTVYTHDPRYGVALTLYCVLGSLLVVATRAHYTLDVLVAWFAVGAYLK